jgi:hypothetical protein
MRILFRRHPCQRAIPSRRDPVPPNRDIYEIANRLWETATLSDCKPWFVQQRSFDATRSLEDQYPQAIQRLLHPRENHRAFFLRALASSTRPSPGPLWTFANVNARDDPLPRLA